jgi:hypothetical protein
VKSQTIRAEKQKEHLSSAKNQVEEEILSQETQLDELGKFRIEFQHFNIVPLW